MGLAYLAQNNIQQNISQLDDDDIDMIQAILDESESDDDEVIFDDTNEAVPRPRKA